MTLLQSLKDTGKSLGGELGHAWDNVAEGWRALVGRSHAALTHFQPGKAETAQGTAGTDDFPRWGLIAGEMEETHTDFVVRVELPGMDKDDCEISLEGNTLLVRGEKRFETEALNSTYHVMERAYGAFQRAIPLPRNVNIAQAEATFKNGVLTVRLPKAAPDRARRITVH